jgi:mono/diheme cytochrome c family protein
MTLLIGTFRSALLALIRRAACVAAACLAGAIMPLAGLSVERPGPGAPPEQRGEYVFHLAGGCGCHTDFKNKGAFLAGGRGIQTPFGVVYATNITPDRATGLGAWSEADFTRAMTQGVRRDGEPLFPVFPYTSFNRMDAQDLKDLWAYLRTVPPVKQDNRPHELRPPFGLRSSLGPWKALYFKPAPFARDPSASDRVNRGAYIVQALAHCAECHTPRTAMGALNPGMAFAGSLAGPEGDPVPNVTPDRKTGIGVWTPAELTEFLQTGMRPAGDKVQGLMREIIQDGYARTAAADQEAVAAYLKTLKPIVHDVEKPK